VFSASITLIASTTMTSTTAASTAQVPTIWLATPAGIATIVGIVLAIIATILLGYFISMKLVPWYQRRRAERTMETLRETRLKRWPHHKRMKRPALSIEVETANGYDVDLETGLHGRILPPTPARLPLRINVATPHPSYAVGGPNFVVRPDNYGMDSPSQHRFPKVADGMQHRGEFSPKSALDRRLERTRVVGEQVYEAAMRDSLHTDNTNESIAEVQPVSMDTEVHVDEAYRVGSLASIIGPHAPQNGSTESAFVVGEDEDRVRHEARDAGEVREGCESLHESLREPYQVAEHCLEQLGQDDGASHTL
jgi:hypothetical protein